MPASAALSVEAGVVLWQCALHRPRTRWNTKAKAAVSPRERLAAAFVFMAVTVDDNGIVGGRPSSWVGRAAGRTKVKPRKKFGTYKKPAYISKMVFPKNLHTFLTT